MKALRRINVKGWRRAVKFTTRSTPDQLKSDGGGRGGGQAPVRAWVRTGVNPEAVGRINTVLIRARLQTRDGETRRCGRGHVSPRVKFIPPTAGPSDPQPRTLVTDAAGSHRAQGSSWGV